MNCYNLHAKILRYYTTKQNSYFFHILEKNFRVLFTMLFFFSSRIYPFILVNNLIVSKQNICCILPMHLRDFKMYKFIQSKVIKLSCHSKECLHKMVTCTYMFLYITAKNSKR